MITNIMVGSTSNSAWCATSVDSSGSYSTWAYCGWGNTNEDKCAYPFTYSGVEYWECAGQDSSYPW